MEGGRTALWGEEDERQTLYRPQKEERLKESISLMSNADEARKKNGRREKRIRSSYKEEKGRGVMLISRL